mmetsp:Transcript_28316/g.59735  ORF Transcript_28316/g.59735 Transcript_28316/m.59735 type:complete len:133 (+) Transcript_28316:67-465(+)
MNVTSRLVRGGAAGARVAARRPRVARMATAEATVNFSKYSPCGDRYLVTLYEREAKSDGGILLSATAAENQAAGEKLLVGEIQAVPEAADGAPAAVKVGDKVLFAKYGSTETTLEDANVYFVKTSEVLAVVE